MTKPRLFLCSGASVAEDAADNAGRHAVPLEALGHSANVNIKIDDVTRVFAEDVPPRLLDLLEIASYVYSADAMTRRSQEWLDDSIEPWDRDLRFIVPVRDAAFWNQDAVCTSLVSALNFLSGDRFSFCFASLKRKREAQGYLDLGDQQRRFRSADRVVLFSGGLDSLAGAVESATTGLPLVLVSHRPASHLSARQQQLVAALQAQFPATRILHVPIWVNKSTRFHNEPTQRTRSFLFAALGIVVARMLGASGTRFYENGIVSLNLPVADEAIRARSSRTTHPFALRMLGEFASLVTEQPFQIDNPFLFKTKADVVSSIVGNGAGQLIGLSVSCAHTMFKAKGRQHCGTCSQCIDRRIAVLASGNDQLDSQDDYVVDVFTGPRREGYERNIAVHCARHATEIGELSEEQFSERFNMELSRAVRVLPNARAAARDVFTLHQRYAADVKRVLTQQLSTHAMSIVDRSLDRTSMLGLIAGLRHDSPLWRDYADRIGEILQIALPKACATHRPKTEPHLQEIADGILKGYDPDLIREFPFARWSSSATKPDWSKEEMQLWIELKYVRDRKDVRPITKDIAEDITKYGDNGRRVLFVVFDPHHLIPDDSAFAQPITSRASMQVRFIR